MHICDTCDRYSTCSLQVELMNRQKVICPEIKIQYRYLQYLHHAYYQLCEIMLQANCIMSC